ncbi:COP9 signalosome complex subunit 7a isoform X2 [Pan paniscus]|uniref:COP9 signalosome complex subunit 7a isoform X1 n=3 Tax=Homininae TaxID=207598 RepID=UPI0004F07561|nr:COP9 signalosome complex subunit 7a isoform X2 [Pan troglodytes]XP_054520006.1 COP9 signalosome complex subunit 7a isoform X2 [Pan troglodytes]XP_054520007.1 COP9 signalosome complex subunit 7a isoform X2 [Pan troglodytes]XP_054951293.1 COP9 signalosome complex subunit 7a isoform X2 [Pan paniscus]XP_054951294.1 COP9 signalosome complex subunit 7a isoform X2 [Pan paniscus]
MCLENCWTCPMLERVGIGWRMEQEGIVVWENSVNKSLKVEMSPSCVKSDQRGRELLLLAESDFASTFRLLTVFAYGTYADYLAEARNLPPLTEAQKNKLRHLSVVTLAAKVKCIPYAVLLEALALRNVRQLEDLVIEAVYADVLRGSLDQRNQRLEVDYSIGRDIQRQDLSAIARTLQEWCVGCEVVLSGIEEQVSRANQHKEQQLGLKQQIESEVANLKKTIKVTTAAAAAATSQDPEQHLTELREPAPGTNQRQPSKKASKGKGLRGSAKIWSKSN